MASLGLASMQVRQKQFEPAIKALQELSQRRDGPLPVDAVLVQRGRGQGQEAVPVVTAEHVEPERLRLGGMEQHVDLIEGRRYHLPDGSDRFLVDEAMLRDVTTSLGGELIEPIKTTIVENLRAMTTWVVIKK